MPSYEGELSSRLRQQSLLAEIGRRALSKLEFEGLLEEACRLTALGLNTRFCPDVNVSLVATERTEVDDLRAAQQDHRADIRTSILGVPCTLVAYDRASRSHRPTR